MTVRQQNDLLSGGIFSSEAQWLAHISLDHNQRIYGTDTKLKDKLHDL